MWKDTVWKTRTQTAGQEAVFVMYVTDRRLVFRPLQINFLKGWFFKNRQMKQHTTYWKINRKLLIIRETQTITARRYFMLFWLAERKNLTISNVGKVRNHETPIPYAGDLLERTSLKKHLTWLNKVKGAHVQPPSNSSAREKSLSVSLNMLVCVHRWHGQEIFMQCYFWLRKL